MKNFRDLKVWQKSHQLTLDTYKTTATFPKEEQYGITSQMRRAASSVSANIAEGCCRGSDADFARFLQIAISSASELEYFLLLSHDLNLLELAHYQQLHSDVTEAKRMLTALIQKLKAGS